MRNLVQVRTNINRKYFAVVTFSHNKSGCAVVYHRAHCRRMGVQAWSLCMDIALESPDQPEVIALIAALDAYQDSLYPPEARYALDLTALMQPQVLFAADSTVIWPPIP